MADFRVADHHRWRSAAGGTRKAARRGPMDLAVPVYEDVDEPAAPAETPLARFVQLPARLHDLLFRPLRGHRGLFLSARFLLVLVAVLLIMQGVVGATEVRLETGTSHSVTNPATVQTYLAPGSTHKYPIDVAVGNDGRLSALFTNDRGVVRVPSMGAGGTMYGLEVAVTKTNPNMNVHLLVAQPGESYRSVPVVRESRTEVVFDGGLFDEPGEYGLLVRSSQGVGPARLAITIVEAPVERVAADRLAWFPLLSGATLATVLVGPYLPGAAAVTGATARRAGRSADESALDASPVVLVGAPDEDVPTGGYARLTVDRAGLHLTRRAGASAEELAAGPGRGLVLRDE